jgi:DNA-binding PadR family transcriptional regulator
VHLRNTSLETRRYKDKNSLFNDFLISDRYHGIMRSIRQLSKHQFLALTALLRGPMHPFALRQEIVELSGRQVWPPHSTLRKVLDSLLAAGYIEECSSNNDPYYWLKARRGAPYALTDKGHAVVRRELSMYYEVIVKSRGWLETVLH